MTPKLLNVEKLNKKPREIKKERKLVIVIPDQAEIKELERQAEEKARANALPHSINKRY